MYIFHISFVSSNHTVYRMINFLFNQPIYPELLHVKPNPESNLLETVAARLFRSGHCPLLHVHGRLILLHVLILLFFSLLRWSVQKTSKARSLQIGSGWNLVGNVQVNMHQLTQSHCQFNTVSRRRHDAIPCRKVMPSVGGYAVAPASSWSIVHSYL